MSLILFQGFLILVIALWPLCFVLSDVLRDMAAERKWRALQKQQHKERVAAMWRDMGAIGLRPSDYTDEQLRQMQERA